MKEKINLLSDNTIQDILETAQALIGRSALALEREYSRSRPKHSNTYILKTDNSSIIWFTNIFDVCDISLVQFNSDKDAQSCIIFCNDTMEIMKPNLWVNQDTIIQYYKEASGQNTFLVGWKHSLLLR